MTVRRFVFRGFLVGIAIIVIWQRTSVSAQPSTSPAGLSTGQDTLAYLNQTIDWYRYLALTEQSALDASDALFLNDDRQVAKQILRLSFDFARANAQFLAKQSPSNTVQDQSADSAQYAGLFRAADAADAEAKNIQSQLASLKQKLATAPESKRGEPQATIDEVQSDLDLTQTRSQTLRNILQFAKSGTGGGNLLTQIDELQRSIPEVAADAPKVPGTPAAPAVAAVSTPAPSTVQAFNHEEQASGMLNLATDLFTLSGKISSLDRAIVSTDAMVATSRKLQAPLVATLRAAAQSGDQLAKQADSSDAKQLEDLKRQLDVLTANFKQISSVAVPLERQAILFDLYRANLVRWRGAVQNRYSVELRSLIFRLAGLTFALIVLFVLAEIWRKATIRYVPDLRRRHQFLVLRRVVLWCAIAITVTFSLATEIGSLVTFAGLITAGLAVALQNVILAVAGYFFLVGKHGVRVGDRVQISGVTGNVVDIGLIRIQLMELGGVGTDRQPTGRIVVFSNAIVFQPAASFFKQIPGTNFGWHEVTLILSPDSDYGHAEKRIFGAVESVYAQYREPMEKQAQEVERTFALGLKVPQPNCHLRFTQVGLEVVIRYPLDLENSSEIDDQITRQLLEELEKAPKLQLVGIRGRPIFALYLWGDRLLLLILA